MIDKHQEYTVEGNLELEVTFNSSAEILEILAHVPRFDEVLKIEVDSFERKYPREFARLQKTIDAKAGYIRLHQHCDGFKFHPLVGVTR